MEDKHRDIVSDMLYLISRDIHNLLDKDFNSLEDAIIKLEENVEMLSDNFYKDKVVYNSISAGKVTYNIE